MNYTEQRPSKNIRELFENNFALFVEPSDAIKIIVILKEADKYRLEYLKRKNEDM